MFRNSKKSAVTTCCRVALYPAILLAAVILGTIPALGQCLSGGGYGFIQVKTTYNGYIFVADDDCNKIDSYAVYAFSLTLVDFTAGRAATIAPGMGDPGVHTTNPMTTFPPSDVDGIPGWEGPYAMTTLSLRDIGTYDYLFEGLYTDGYDVWPMTSDVMGFYIDNDPPTGNVNAGGPYHVGDTVTLSAGASDPDGGSITYDWAVTSKPPSSPSGLSSGSAASPTITLGSKHDIGNWQVRLRFADNEAERVTDTDSFTVENRPPVVSISGPTEIDALSPIMLTASPATDQDGETVTFVWDLLSSPPNTVHQPQSSFTTGNTVNIATGPDEIGVWEFQVTGTDEHDADNTDTHTITVNPVPPEIDLVGLTEIDAGQAIDLETLIVLDAYGDPLVSFDWEVQQVPISAGVPLGTIGSSAQLFIPTSASDAGTWRFKLTVTDQVGETDEEMVSVLVDGLPTASIVGPAQTSSLLLDLTLDGSGSEDPDSPSGPPDYGHLHDGTLDISPGIIRYSWNVISVPPEHWGDYFPGPVADVFGVNGSSSMLYFAPAELVVGDWVFELEIEDGEGNVDYASHPVTVLKANLPPLAILSPPSYHLTTSEGFATSLIGASGALSFDLDNLLDSAAGPGLGITDYSWSWAFFPPTCLSPPILPSGSSASEAIMYVPGQLIDGPCQGIYQPMLTVTDDDTPTPLSTSNSTLVLIGNCAGLLCIDHPTNAVPEFVKFSDQTNILIFYHLNSVLYDNPVYTAGLRLQLLITPSLSLGPVVYSKAWDLDLLPSDKGGPLVVHWSGFTNTGARPEPGLYDVTLQLVDAGGTPTSDVVAELSAIQIQLLDVAVAAGADALLNLNGVEAATDFLEIPYDVTGAPPGDLGYDQIVFRVYELGTDALVYDEAVTGPFGGSVQWSGEVVPGLFIDPGTYEIELEIYDSGASLGVSARHEFDAYRVNAELAGIADADELDPGAVLGIGDSVALTVSIKGDLTRLGGEVTIDVTDQEGTLAADDGTVSVNIDTGATFLATGFTTPLTLTLEGVDQGNATKTVILAEFIPASATVSNKTAQDQVAVTVADASAAVAASDPARQDSVGVFLRGQRMPEVVTPANFAGLTPQMLPIEVKAGPEFGTATVELSMIAGSATNLELYEAGSATPVTLPKVWTAPDFSSGELEKELLAYGKAFGEARLKVEYKDGSTVLASQELLLRIGHQPPVVGLALPAGQFPFFLPLEVQNAGSPVQVAIDPVRHDEWLGRNVALYLVPHKSLADWVLDPTLTDVTGGPNTVMVSGASVAANTHVIWASPTQGHYDLVIDMGNAPPDPAAFAADGQLDPGDYLIQQPGGAASLSVYGDFSTPGPSGTATVEFGMAAGPSTTPVADGWDGLSVAPAADYDFRLRGRVVHPNPMPVAGTLPIVMIAHGNHLPRTLTPSGGATLTLDPLMTSDENFRGHTWLQEWLASHGFITISVDLDEMIGGIPGFDNAPTISGHGIMLRSWVLLKNLELAATDATFAGGILNGKIDLGRVYFIGHSRGGEAVLGALEQIGSAAARPPGATLDLSVVAATVKGIVSLAPMSRALNDGDISAHDVPFLLLYGTADGDVSGEVANAAPFRQYDNSTGLHAAAVIEGANHNFWNDSWGFSDAAQSLACNPTFTSCTSSVLGTPVGSGLISKIQQKNAAIAYIGAFLEILQNEEVNGRAYFDTDASRLRPMPVDPALVINTQSRRDTGDLLAVIDDYQANDPVGTASGGTTVTLTSLGGADEDRLFDADLGASTQPMDRFFQETRGVVFDWSGAASYALDLPAGARDLRGAKVLSFRVAQQPDHPRTVALGGNLEFAIELEDGSANTVKLSSSTIATARAIYSSTVGGTSTTSGIFQTYRIPLSSFATDGSALDMSDVRKIRLVFGGAGHSGQGRIAVDEVEIE